MKSLIWDEPSSRSPALIPGPVSRAFRCRFRGPVAWRFRPVVRAVWCSRRVVAGLEVFSRASHGV